MEQRGTEERRTDELTGRVRGACIEVHRCLGPGLLESAYDHCLAHELGQRGLRVRRQVSIPVTYKGLSLRCGYRIDLLVEESLVVEVKAVEKILPVHGAQVITYLKLTGLAVGLLVNFQVPFLREGIRRLFPPSPNPSVPPFLFVHSRPPDSEAG
jgi:GxxExxY protein